MKKRIALMILWATMTAWTYGQNHEVFDRNIASLQVVSGDNWTELPIITLGQQTPIVIEFDYLSHDYHRYSYKVEHCEADWTISEAIFESDFCEGFARGNTIGDFRQSLNTNQLYTHYRLQIPNEQCKLKMSGNYKVTIYDEDDKAVLTVCFMVVEPLMSIGMEVTTNTDMGLNGKFQQVNMSLNYHNMKVTNPSTQIKTVVMQNNRWHSAVFNTKPQYINANGLVWQHNRELIFDGGNEHRKFEMLDINHATMGMESVTWDGQMYHVMIWPDEPRPSYVYDEDADGAFRIRNSDYQDSEILSEYAMVHFRLATPRQNGEIYLNGAWTQDRFTPQYKMVWNESTQLYEANVWLKQGYYNYQYLHVLSDGTIKPLASEGNFYQTQNTYQALIYFRGNGERTDRLVGYGKVNLR